MTSSNHISKVAVVGVGALVARLLLSFQFTNTLMVLRPEAIVANILLRH